MNAKLSEIVHSLTPNKISQNNKGEFWEITSAYLILGAKITNKSIVPNKFDFKGWYRLFDTECVTERTEIVGGFQQAVVSEDEARLRILKTAVSDTLVQPDEELIDSAGSLPTDLYILSARQSFLDVLSKIATQNEADLPWGVQPVVKRSLGVMRSVNVCSVPENVIRALYN